MPLTQPAGTAPKRHCGINRGEPMQTRTANSRGSGTAASSASGGCRHCLDCCASLTSYERAALVRQVGGRPATERSGRVARPLGTAAGARSAGASHTCSEQPSSSFLMHQISLTTCVLLSADSAAVWGLHGGPPRCRRPRRRSDTSTRPLIRPFYSSTLPQVLLPEQRVAGVVASRTGHPHRLLLP